MPIIEKRQNNKFAFKCQERSREEEGFFQILTLKVSKMSSLKDLQYFSIFLFVNDDDGL